MFNKKALILIFLVLSLALPLFNFEVVVDAQPQPIYTIPSQKDNIDWSHFWSLVNQHSAWDLEYSTGAEWTSIKSDLDITKDFIGNETCKITLDFTASQSADYRLTFGIDLDVKSYIHKEDSWNYTLSYDQYSVNFDWSDVKEIPNLQISHGIKNVTLDGGATYVELFWFRIRRDNVPQGANVVIDPSISYVELMAEITTSHTWQPQDLEGFGVPADCVVELIAYNIDAGAEHDVGAREVGSSITLL